MDRLPTETNQPPGGSVVFYLPFSPSFLMFGLAISIFGLIEGHCHGDWPNILENYFVKLKGDMERTPIHNVKDEIITLGDLWEILLFLYFCF